MITSRANVYVFIYGNYLFMETLKMQNRTVKVIIYNVLLNIQFICNRII